MRRRILAGLAALAVAASTAACTAGVPGSGGTGAGASGSGAAPVASASAVAGAQDSLRPPGTAEQFYFVLPDRFANGSTANDQGGLSGDRTVTGFDPTDKKFYHGGDLAGLTGKLDYIAGLGTTAIWLTPSFKNRPVQGIGIDQSSGYHGYWTTDFTQIDPHLGTNDEMKALIAAAHAKGIKVYFDIITNHTADVIQYEGQKGAAPYVDKNTKPYRDASGQPFDDAAAGASGSFPTVDATTVAPYRPTFTTASDATVKVPAWLNDPTMYHLRGDNTWSGESVTYGDFIGLDDLWTERPEVRQGMIDLYKTWVDFGVDGFRIDTMKHVDMGFWQAFCPAIEAYAKDKPVTIKRAGNDGRHEFFMFGEVYDVNPMVMSQYSTTGKAPGTLDFGFQRAAQAWVQGGSADELRTLYEGDDLYTDADSNAYQSVTFLGNHDMGRIGSFLQVLATGDELLKRVQLAHSLMFLTRGQPVVYYGDEQGLLGNAGDADARQDLFATKTPDYEQPVIAGTEQAQDRYDTSHPLYSHIAGLAKLRAEVPELTSGAQRVVAAEGGLFAFTRWLPGGTDDVLVALNNTTAPVTAKVTPGGGDRTWTAVGAPSATGSASGSASASAAGTAGGTAQASGGSVTLTVPALSYVVYRAPKAAGTPGELTFTAGTPTLDAQGWLTAAWPGAEDASVTFFARPQGGEWHLLGTDDSAGEGGTYRVKPDLTGFASGATVELQAFGKADGVQKSATATTKVAK